MGVSGAIAREVRGDAARRGRRDVHGSGAERRRGARCRDRARVLDVRAHAVAAGAPMLRPRQSRAWRFWARRCSWRRSTAGLIAIDAKDGRPLWNVAVEGARPEAGYAFTLRSAGRQGQGHHRHGRRRVRHSRLPGGLRRPDRQGSVALLHDSRRRANRATTRGPAIPGKPAAPRSG